LQDSHFGNLGSSSSSLSRRTATASAPASTSPASQSRGGKGVINIRATAKIGKVTAINLVDDTTELIVISQFSKIIRIDTKSICRGEAAQRKPKNLRSSGEAADIETPNDEFM
jgi:DNA gyrase/topoisomerase IV subunit A